MVSGECDSKARFVEQMKPPADLDKLVEIPEADILSGLHGNAKCACYLQGDCVGQPKYKMVIEEYPFGEGYYNTAYFCENHRPTK